MSRLRRRRPDETLIDLAHFFDFVVPSFSVYRGFADRSYVNNAMFALTGERSIVNDRFLVYFTALESLLLHARHMSGKGKGVVQQRQERKNEDGLHQRSVIRKQKKQRSQYLVGARVGFQAAKV